MCRLRRNFYTDKIDLKYSEDIVIDRFFLMSHSLGAIDLLFHFAINAGFGD